MSTSSETCGDSGHPTRDFISQKVFIKSFCKNQSPHKSVNLFFISEIIKNELTDLWEKNLWDQHGSASPPVPAAAPRSPPDFSILQVTSLRRETPAGHL